MPMTRTEFIKAYAKRSNMSDKWAVLGFLEFDDRYVWVALPCACEDESCEGWAMVSPSSVASHLELYAPEPISSAFRDLSEGRTVSAPIEQHEPTSTENKPAE